MSGRKKSGVQKRAGKTIVSEVIEGGTYPELLGAIGELLERVRGRTAATANATLVETYWQTGRAIAAQER